MGVPAYDKINAPVRIKYRSKLLILFDSDMRKQNRQINILRTISIADTSYLCSRLLNVDQFSDQPYRVVKPSGIPQKEIQEEADDNGRYNSVKLE